MKVFEADAKSASGSLSSKPKSIAVQKQWLNTE